MSIFDAIGRIFTAPTTEAEQAQKAIAQQQSQLTGQQQQLGTQLESYVTSGGLPPNMQAAVDAALQNADASTRARFAQLGLTGSTMEASQEGQNVQQSMINTGQLEQMLFQLGENAIQQAFGGLSSQGNIWSQIGTEQAAADKALSDQIAAFVGGITKGYGATSGGAGVPGAGAGTSMGAAGDPTMLSALV